MEISAAKSNPIGTQFEYFDVQEKTAKGKFRVKSYDTVELVNEEFSVEVDRVDEVNDVIRTVTDKHEQINVPLRPLPEGEKPPTPGSRLVILMDEGVFVRLKVKAKTSRPKWQV